MTDKDLNEFQEPLTDEMKKKVTVDDVEQLPEVPQVAFFECEICESKQDIFGLTVTIMDLQLQDLIFEKMYILFQKLQPAIKDLETAKIDLQVNKDKFLLETDFEKELGKSRTNKDERMAVIKPLLAPFEDKVDKFEDTVTFYKNKLNILNDLIKAQRTLLTIEGALKQ